MSFVLVVLGEMFQKDMENGILYTTGFSDGWNLEYLEESFSLFRRYDQ
jgi:hypothetical protein